MPATPPLIGTVRVNMRQVLVRAVAVGLLACVLVGVPFLVYIRGEVARAHERTVARERHSVGIAASIINKTVQSIVSDLRYLSGQNELRELLADDTPSLRAWLAQEYAAFLTQKPRYDQVRWIGADGWEKVRVRREGDRIVTFGADHLQNVQERYYFNETMRLAAGQIYVSALELNVDQGRVEEPHKPTLRVALPLFHPDGRRAGILLVNYLATPLLDELRTLIRGKDSNLWLLNSDGYWLLSTEREDEWAFMFPEKQDRSLAVRDPDGWQRLSREHSGHFKTGNSLLTFRRVYPLLHDDSPTPAASGRSTPALADDYYWTVATQLPQTLLEAEISGIARNLPLIYAAFALVAFAVATRLAYHTFRTRAVGTFVQHVLDNVPALVAYVDETEHYRYNNRQYEPMTGLPANALAGQHVSVVLGEAGYQTALPNIRAVLAGKPVSFEARISFVRCGQRDVAVAYVPDTATDGKVRGYIAVMNDITPLKAAERREHERQCEAAHVTRLASVSELASQIAHEVNQPVTAIITYCAAAQHNVHADSPANTRLRGLITAISDEAQRVSTIIRQLRDFVRKGEIAFVPVDLNEIVGNSLQLVAGEAAAHEVEIVTDLATGPLGVKADPVLLSLAVFNLVRNAVEALAGTAVGPRRVTVATRRIRDTVEARVTDTGPGLPPEVAARLFESFVTTKSQGLGMGLSITRTICEAHGGRVQHSPAPGGGCTFTLAIPGGDS